jgi:hypothetical protein
MLRTVASLRWTLTALFCTACVIDSGPSSPNRPPPPPPGQPGARPVATGPGDPLLGAWQTSSGPDGKALPCPLEVEFLADGTIEMNYLNDDSDELACAYWRLPYRTEGNRIFIGQANHPSFACLYASASGALDLACEDRPNPPRDMSDSMRLLRINVREGGGLAAIAGSWRVSPRGAVALSVQPDGSFGPPLGPGRVVVRDASHLELQRSGKRAELCLYRVTDRRLSLACDAGSGSYPPAFGDPRTLVFVRG